MNAFKNFVVPLTLFWTSGRVPLPAVAGVVEAQIISKVADQN